MHNIHSKGGGCYQVQEWLIREAYRESLTTWHITATFFSLGSRVLSINLLGERSTNHAQPKKYNRYHSFYTVPIQLKDRNKKEFWKRKHALPTISVIRLPRKLQDHRWEALNSQLLLEKSSIRGILNTITSRSMHLAPLRARHTLFKH